MDIFKHFGHKLPKIRRTRAAFSLVEVTLAIGIFGFAFTTIVGLIPVGLTTFRHAMDASVGSQICQRVINDAQQTDFDVLTQGANGSSVAKPVRYFDGEGNAVTDPAKSVYQVNTVVTAVTVMPNDATFASLATLAVQIVNNPGNQTIKTNPTTSAWEDPRFVIASYSGLVSRNK